jgi:hypothetical protein
MVMDGAMDEITQDTVEEDMECIFDRLAVSLGTLLLTGKSTLSYVSASCCCYAGCWEQASTVYVKGGYPWVTTPGFTNTRLHVFCERTLEKPELYDDDVMLAKQLWKRASSFANCDMTLADLAMNAIFKKHSADRASTLLSVRSLSHALWCVQN